MSAEADDLTDDDLMTLWAVKATSELPMRVRPATVSAQYALCDKLIALVENEAIEPA